MTFRILIEEIFPATNLEVERREPVKRFEQVVDVLDLPAVFAAINKPPRKPRARKPKP